MLEVLTKQKAIDEIMKEAKNLNKLELQILLMKLRVKIIKKEGVKAASNPPKGLKPPTMQEIDQWKHEARKQNAER